MRKEGIIYQYGGAKSGVVFSSAFLAEEVSGKRPGFNPGKGLSLSPRRVFKGFVLGGFLGLLLLLAPLIFQEIEYRARQVKGEKVVVVDPAKQQSFGDLLKARNIKILKPVDTNFSLVIPKINLNSKIVPNVDPSDKNKYLPALKIGAAQAAGTSLPGEGGKIYLFAHSTDYLWHVPQFNAVFYLLKELREGDEVNIFYKGGRFVYKVTEKKIVEPSQTYYLKPKRGEEILILQTCWPPGTTWKRLIVFAKPVL